MNRLLRTATLIVLAMLGSAILLVGLINLTTKLTIYAKAPADFLDANEVVALLHQPDAETLRLWADIYPVLEKLPATPYDAVAIINRDERIAIGFTLSKESVPNRIGPFAVTSTHAGGTSLNAHAPTLARSAQYTELAKHFVGKTTWTYVQLPEIPNPPIATELLHAFIAAKNTAIAVELDGNTLTTTTLDNRREQMRFSSEEPEARNAVLSLRMTNGSASFDALRSHLSKDSRAIIDGLARGMLTTYGDDLSLPYDLLTLLQEPSSLSITATGAQIGVVLSGEHDNTKELHTIVDHFHSAYTNTLPATKVTKRVLDTRFSSVDIRHDESMIENTQKNIDGWFVRGTSHREMRSGIFSAVQGNLFRIGTSEELVAPSNSPNTQIMPTNAALELISLHLNGAAAQKALTTLSSASIFPASWYTQELTVRSFLGNGIKTVEIHAESHPLLLIESLVF